MRRIIFTLALVLSIASSATAGPIMDAAQAAVAQPAPKTVMKNPALAWGGVAMSGVGGFMLGYGLFTPHEVSCVALFGVVSCEETGANRNALIGVGAALVGTGMVFSVIGSKKVAVAPSRRGMTASLRF